MQFNDQKSINTVKSLHELEVEPLYWVIEDAITDNKLERAKAFHMLFCYIAKFKKELLRQLNKEQISRIKNMSYELYNESYVKNIPAIDIKYEIKQSELSFKTENDLRNYLIENREILEKALSSKIEYIESEVVVSKDFRCDMLVRTPEKYFIIELKIEQGNHAVVSQIMKYCNYFYGRFRYIAYKPIQGVVIANGFCDWSINELRRNNIKCFICKDISSFNLEAI